MGAPLPATLPVQQWWPRCFFNHHPHAPHLTDQVAQLLLTFGSFPVRPPPLTHSPTAGTQQESATSPPHSPLLSTPCPESASTPLLPFPTAAAGCPLTGGPPPSSLRPAGAAP